MSISARVHTPGNRLAHYQLVEKIGEGGMGVVWKAHDTTLGRDVAIKVLPDLFASDPERLARFEREARLLASLNHPRIAAIYGFHAESGARFLAMELAEGESLAARLERGPLPVPDALAVARQVAEALETAHERGIVHRDLKPGNIMLAPDGSVKVLDFGLAKALEGDRGVGSSPNLSQSPTITQAMTSANVILGTAAYMSPEQARGQAADKRSDVWAFGVILFEMLTGQRLFLGDTISDTLAAVLRGDPDWKSLPRETPARVRRLIERCLARDVRVRLRDIGEARILLDDVAAGRGEEVVAAPVAAAKAPVVRYALLGVAGVAVGAVIALGLGRMGAKPDEVPLRRFVVAGRDSGGVVPTEPVISPDGRSVAYLIGNALWVRSLDAIEGRRLAAHPGLAHPFWSPDSRFLGFIAGTRIMKVPVSGGEPQLISDVRKAFTSGAGACWRDDDVIVCSRAEEDGLLEVPAIGGDPRTVVAIDTTAESDLHEPSALPGNRGVVYVVHRTNGTDTIELFARGKRKVLLQLEGHTLARPVYSATGHILFRRSPSTGIWALPFSIDRLEATGAAFLVAANGNSPSVALDGTLAYRAGNASATRQLSWVDRTGNTIEMIGDPEDGLDVMLGPRLSPDGVHVAVGQQTEGNEIDIWIFDTVRRTKTRLTFEPGSEDDPVWTPDGTRIAYTASPPNCTSLPCLSVMIRSADGTGTPDTLARGLGANLSPDGRSLAYSAPGQLGTDLALLALEPRGTSPTTVREDEVQITGPVSPNGKFVAYISFESGRSEVYLKRFPSWSGKWQVSTEGGGSPRWNGAGDRLYYAYNDDYFEVEVSGQDSPVLGAPRRLFVLRPSARAFRDLPGHFDVTRDGQRFLVVRPAGAQGQGAEVIAVQNWFAEFRDSKKP